MATCCTMHHHGAGRGWRRRLQGWETGQPTTLRIERHGESTKTTFRLLVDGVPVADGLRVPGIGATTEQLRFGIFVEGEPGRSANVRIDDVEFIYKERG